MITFEVCVTVHHNHKVNEYPTWCNQCLTLLQVLNNSTCFGRMHPSSGVVVFVTSAKRCSGVSVVEGTAWVAVVWRRAVAEGASSGSLSYSTCNKVIHWLHQVGYSFTLERQTIAYSVFGSTHTCLNLAAREQDTIV
jgi:hypothetical protein